MSQNPLLETDGLPKFNEIKAEHVEPGVEEALAHCEKILLDLESKKPTSWDDLVPHLDHINRIVHRCWSPVSHLLATQNSEAMRAAHEKMQPKIVQFGLRYSQSKQIYESFKAIKNSPTWSKLERAQQRIVEANIKDAELSGIALTGDKKQRFNEIANELSQLATTFSNNVLDSTKAFSMTLRKRDEVAGLPESALALASQSYNGAEADKTKHGTSQQGPWRFTLDLPSYLSYMQNAICRERREEIYRAFLTRASKAPHDNTENITKILRLRHEKAQLLGFQTFAELSLAKKMAPSVKAVDKLSEDLLKASLGPAKKEFQDLQTFAQGKGHQGPLMHWDIPYWTERMREDKFEYSDEELKPYFALPRVLDGMFKLVTKLFGITVKAADGEAPIWHKDVRFFKIFDADGTHRASFYLDPFSRPETKRGGAWMDDCSSRESRGGKVEVPVAHLVCNSTPPVGETPSLMTFQEVETLFHEFGHGLQHMLTTVNFTQAAGISLVEWDAVELPSQFMENWCYHEPTMFELAKHYKTGEVLPKELFEKVKAAKNFMSATFMLRQLRFGITDMELHHNFDPYGKKTIFDLSQEIAKRSAVIEPLPEDRMLCSFSHIFAGGYAAGYYSYKWAEVLSADAFSAFEEAGLNESSMKKVGARFKETILSLGGSEHPLEVFKAFRGREPKIDALLMHSGLRAG